MSGDGNGVQRFGGRSSAEAEAVRGHCLHRFWQHAETIKIWKFRTIHLSFLTSIMAVCFTVRVKRHFRGLVPLAHAATVHVCRKGHATLMTRPLMQLWPERRYWCVALTVYLCGPVSAVYTTQVRHSFRSSSKAAVNKKIMNVADLLWASVPGGSVKITQPS